MKNKTIFRENLVTLSNHYAIYLHGITFKIKNQVIVDNIKNPIHLNMSSCQLTAPTPLK